MDNEPYLADGQPGPKRRKVRKGTQSCWECRRRKVRCIFTTLADSVCEGCKRRKTACISQEFPNTSANLDGGPEVSDRLSRLEETVEWLVQKAGPGPGNDPHDGPENHPNFGSRAARNVTGEGRSSSSDAPRSHIGRATSTPLNVEPGSPSRSSVVIGSSVRPARGSIDAAGYEGLSRKLVSAWPSEHDLELILNTPFEILGVFHGSIYAPYSTLLCQQLPSPREILRLPPPGAHPVLIARKLLTLAICLQGLLRSSIRDLGGLDATPHDIMVSAVEAVRGCVTLDDELLESIEGVGCVIMESTYHNNAGQLHRAWRCTRRAMLIAQMIGLHRGGGGSVVLPSSVFLEAETRVRVYPEYMWFRLVQWDRYLSLMLGLPQGTSSNSFADRRVLEDCTPTERMQRVECAIGGYILQRNESDLHDLATTRKIDKLLQRFSASLPLQWWLVPRFSSGIGAGDDIAELEKIIRAMDQFTHFHLVTQLHLPYLLRPLTEREYDYSKITAVNASREALQRFVSYLGVDAVTSFCRGINLIVFVSCTVICIAHIDAHRQSQIHPHNHHTVFDTLVHQRHSDRAMMELALGNLEQTARESDDVLAPKIAGILAHLLSIEADAALRGDYVAGPSAQSAEDGPGCNGKLVEGGKMLLIYLPYLGNIVFRRGDGSRPTTAVSRTAAEGLRTMPVPAMLLSDAVALTSLLSIPELPDEPEQRPLVVTNTALGNQFFDPTVNSCQTAPLHHNQSQQPRSALDDSAASYFPRDQQLFVDTDENTWTVPEVNLDNLGAIFDDIETLS